MNALKKITLATSIVTVALMSSLATAGNYGSKGGDMLTDLNGMTLYTFDKDKKGESVCYDGCAAKWPPYLASDHAKGKKGFKVITRKDGSKQWAYKNQPLYTWVGDAQPGDTTGDGVGGVWHIAKEKAAYSYNSSSSGSSY